MAKKTENQDMFSIKSILLTLKNNWYWFTLSVVICGGLGVLKILSTMPLYNRTEKILIKDDSSNSSTDLGSLTGLDFLSNSSNIYNELSIIQSPDLMRKVVEQLELTKQYFTDEDLHRIPLYGSTQIVDIDIDSLHRTYAFRLNVEILSDNEFEISKIRRSINKKTEKYNLTIEGRFGEPVATPIGDITITKTPAYEHYDMEYPMPVYFSYRNVRSATRYYAGAVKSSVQDQKSSIIQLSIDDASRARANDILRTIVSVYNQYWMDERNQVAINTNRFIDERLKDIEEQLTDVDSEISQYKSDNLITSVAAISDMNIQKADKTDEALVNLQSKVYIAKHLRDYLKTIPSDETMPINSGFESEALSRQISEYNKNVIERNKLVALSSVNNPAVVDMDAALASTRKSIIASVETEIVNLNMMVDNVRRSQDKAVSQIASNPEQARYLVELHRQQTVKEQLYLYLLQKREENQLSQTFSTQNAQIIQSPDGDDTPVSPRVKMIVLMSLFFGFGIPYGIILLIDKLNTTVRTRDDIEDLTVPFLGIIPQYTVSQSKNIFKVIKRKLHKPTDEEINPPTVAVKKGSRNFVNEAFRMLRTNITMMVGRESTGNVLSVTSFNPGSGKSFISMNLGMVFAFKNKRVLIIDCDLRHGSASQYVGNPGRGIVDYLTGVTNDYRSLIINYPEIRGLDVLPVGAVPPNPTELLENGRLEIAVKELKKEYDMIFLDCPPVNIVADTEIIENLVDRTIFVARAGLLERSQLPDLQRDYDEHRFPNMAMLLNGVHTQVSKSDRKSYYFTEE